MSIYERYNKSYINGEWVEGQSGRKADVLNPFDESVLFSISLASSEQVADAFAIANEAQKQWANSPAEVRAEVMKKAAEFLRNNRDEIVPAMSRETGSSLLKSNIEFDLTLEILDAAPNFVHQVHTVKEFPAAIPGKINRVYRLPLGVISSISPFNFPMNLSMRTIAPAIALGNTVVHKPGNQVIFTGGGIIAAAFEYAGLPKGVFNLVVTDSREIGDEMLTNPIPKLISFTGSTEVGRHIGKIAGENLKRVALELGGNNPFIVLADADLERAVDAAIFGKYIHQGQICMSINRIIVHKDLYEPFIEKFVDRAKQIPYGDPLDPDTIIGPLINGRQVEKVLRLIEEAKAAGNKLALEGKRVGNILTPFIFRDVKNSDKIAQEELFSPVVSIIKAESDEEALQMANDTQYGLTSAVFTTDLVKGEEFARQIDSGMTHINDQTVNDAPNIPFGGNKASGVGRFGNPYMVDEFTTTKWISVQTEYRQFPF